MTRGPGDSSLASNIALRTAGHSRNIPVAVLLVADVEVGVVGGPFEKGKSLGEEVVADGSSPAGMMSMRGRSSSRMD